MESVIELRLNSLYSYSKQSLAPAVSTVGFSFRKIIHFDQSDLVINRRINDDQDERTEIPMDSDFARFKSFVLTEIN